MVLFLDLVSLFGLREKKRKENLHGDFERELLRLASELGIGRRFPDSADRREEEEANGVESRNSVEEEEDFQIQVTELRKENNQILTTINITTQHFLNVEAENSVLRAQMAELKQRLDSLNEILNFINSSNGVFDNDGIDHQAGVDSFMNLPFLNQPIMASADILPYWWLISVIIIFENDQSLFVIFCLCTLWRKKVPIIAFVLY